MGPGLHGARHDPRAQRKRSRRKAKDNNVTIRESLTLIRWLSLLSKWSHTSTLPISTAGMRVVKAGLHSQTAAEDMRFYLFPTLSVVGIFYVLAAGNTTQTSKAALPKEDYWQTGSACGPNALYCMLRVNDRAVSYLQLLTFLSPAENGSSLEELRTAANHWGLSTTVYKLDRSSIGELRIPFIAHLAVQDLQHHVVVVGLAKDAVLIWDDEKGTAREVANERFFRDWTGYVLSSGTRSTDRYIGGILLVEITCLFVVFGLLVKNWIRRRQHRRMDHA